MSAEKLKTVVDRLQALDEAIGEAGGDRGIDGTNEGERALLRAIARCREAIAAVSVAALSYPSPAPPQRRIDVVTAGRALYEGPSSSGMTTLHYMEVLLDWLREEIKP